MIAITNKMSVDPMGRCLYEVRIKDKVICQFRHRRSEGLAECLRQASEAVLEAGISTPIEPS